MDGLTSIRPAAGGEQTGIYHYDALDREFLAARIATFRDQVERRLSGALTEEEFKPLRLMNGLYLQLHAYMLRVAIPYGILSSTQMRKLAQVGRVYDRDYGHFTTRQNIQFNWIKLEQAPDILAELAEVEERVNRCFEAGALATGCTLEITPESKPYAEFRTYEPALEAYVRNATALGRVFDDHSPARRMNRASTDMGNVSQVVPAIHPYIGLGTYPVLNHQAAFADACVGPTAERAVLDGAIALAWTALDMAGVQGES